MIIDIKRANTENFRIRKGFFLIQSKTFWALVFKQGVTGNKQNLEAKNFQKKRRMYFRFNDPQQQ